MDGTVENLVEESISVIARYGEVADNSIIKNLAECLKQYRTGNSIDLLLLKTRIQHGRERGRNLGNHELTHKIEFEHEMFLRSENERLHGDQVLAHLLRKVADHIKESINPEKKMKE